MAEIKPIEPERVIPNREINDPSVLVFPVNLYYKMKKIISILLFVAISLSISAQFSITGNVTDESASVLSFVPVNLANTNYSGETDENGNFAFSEIPAGRYVLQISYLGFYDYEFEVLLLSDQKLDVVLKKKSIQLQDIYINGTRTDDKMPFTYKNIGKEIIEKKNFGEDIPYLLGHTPSVVSTSDGGSGIGYTGIRIRGSDATRINVTVNNIPINDSESQQVYWVDLPDLAGSAESIQIQRGVGTSTNGAGAFGASINILTNQIRYDPYVSVDASYGSFNSKKITAKAGTGLMNEKYSIDLRYSLLGSDGYIDRAEAALNSFFVSAASVGRTSSLRFNALFGKEKTYQAWDGVPVQYKDIDSLRKFNVQGTDYFRLNPPYDNQIDDYTQNHFQLFYNKKYSDVLVLNLAGHLTRGYGFYEQYKADEDLSEYKLDTSKVRYSDLVRQKWLSNYFYGFVYNLKYSSDYQNIVFGGALNNYDGDHFGVVRTILKLPAYEENEVYYLNTGKKTDFNTYLKYLISPSEKLNAFVDLQYRYIGYTIKGDDDDGREHNISDKLHFFNPKVGISFNFSKNFNFYTSYAVSNKEPNRVDYINVSENTVPKPEKLYDLETGFRYNSKNMSLQSNLYYMNYKNQLVLTGKLDNVGNPIRENVEKSYRLGIENEIEFRIREFLSADANLTLSKNKIREFKELISVWDEPYIPEQYIHLNKDISYSPGVTAGAGISLDFLRLKEAGSKNSLMLNIAQKYVGKQYLDNTGNDIAALDPYYFTDLSLSYKMSTSFIDNLEISLKIGNLFSHQYESNGYASQFRSAGYDPRPDDPFTIKNRNDYYYYIGLFPQALRNYMIRVKIDLQ